MWLEGLHLARIFEMRSHLILRSMWQTHYFKMSLTPRLMRSKSLMTSRIRLTSNDAPRQWNWIDKIPIRKQLSIDNNIISTKVTTGNAPNNLKVINNTVEDTYAISEENSDEQGTVNKINVLPNQSNLTPITIMVVDTISANTLA